VAVLTAIAVLLGLAPAALARWHPPKRFTWYWQLDGRIPNSVNASVYDIDGLPGPLVEVEHAAGFLQQAGSRGKILGQHLKPPTDLDVAQSLGRMQHELREKYVTLRSRVAGGQV
jgi:hypothetical protein